MFKAWQRWLASLAESGLAVGELEGNPGAGAVDVGTPAPPGTGGDVPLGSCLAPGGGFISLTHLACISPHLPAAASGLTGGGRWETLPVLVSMTLASSFRGLLQDQSAAALGAAQAGKDDARGLFTGYTSAGGQWLQDQAPRGDPTSIV